MVASDVVGNETVYSFEVRDDCEAPGVEFTAGYVGANPEVQLAVRDDGEGVDWNTVYIDFYQRKEGQYDNRQYKACTFTPTVIADYRTGDVVTLSCNMDLENNTSLAVYVFSEKFQDAVIYPSYGKGPADLAGNYLPKWQECIYPVDAVAPSIKVISTSSRPIEICITDSKSGVDWSTLMVYEDSLLICEGLGCQDSTVNLDTATGCLEYMPPAGRLHVDIYVKDFAGNQLTYTFYTEEEELSFKNPHNYPNPFDPGITTIVLGLSKSAEVTAKIYDFAGEYVTTLCKDKSVGISETLSWNGATEDGTPLADGTYLCHLKARDGKGAVKTAVIKITVLKKD